MLDKLLDMLVKQVTKFFRGRVPLTIIEEAKLRALIKQILEEYLGE